MNEDRVSPSLLFGVPPDRLEAARKLLDDRPLLQQRPSGCALDDPILIPIAKRRIRKIIRDVAFIVVAFALGVLATRVAHGQVMAQARIDQIKDMLPGEFAGSADGLDAKIDDPSTLWYTDAEIPPAHQKWDSGIMGVMDVKFDFNGPQADPTGTPNRDFPWKVAAGLHNCNNVYGVKFICLPVKAPRMLARAAVAQGMTSALGSWPIVVFRARLPGDSQDAFQWIFPVGSIVGEVLIMRMDGADYCFEVRTRTRTQRGWDVDAFRPYPTSKDFAKALREKGNRNDPHTKALVESLERTPLRLPIVGTRDKLPLRRVFAQSSGIEELPELSPALAKALLLVDTFHSSAGIAWRKDTQRIEAHAASTSAPHEIVPAGYRGNLIAVDHVSCARCHVTTGHHAEEFADTPNQRDWYGRVRGSDGIFSFHPFDPSCVNDSAVPRPVTFRKALFEAGIVANYDRQKHPPELYCALAEYNPSLMLPSFNRSR